MSLIAYAMPLCDAGKIPILSFWKRKSNERKSKTTNKKLNSSLTLKSTFKGLYIGIILAVLLFENTNILGFLYWYYFLKQSTN